MRSGSTLSSQGAQSTSWCRARCDHVGGGGRRGGRGRMHAATERRRDGTDVKEMERLSVVCRRTATPVLHVCACPSLLHPSLAGMTTRVVASSTRHEPRACACACIRPPPQFPPSPRNPAQPRQSSSHGSRQRSPHRARENAGQGLVDGAGRRRLRLRVACAERHDSRSRWPSSPISATRLSATRQSKAHWMIPTRDERASEMEEKRRENRAWAAEEK
ncbi:hypothetical protein C8R47DRAFT_170799 [Mycena vitilis]|nr:hypothetical protein C8R47DRAFT_170799 [Mycena vitilis]